MSRREDVNNIRGAGRHSVRDRATGSRARNCTLDPTIPAARWPRLHRVTRLYQLSLLLALPAGSATPPATPQALPAPVLVTNQLLVTNLVVVTNYVVVTNTAPRTNVLAKGKTTPPLPQLSWFPPEDPFDWIQLNTGEWLKGRLKAMQDQKIEFDSEKLELLTFDWEDIRQARFPHYNELLFEKDGRLAGPVTITPDEVTLGGAEPRRFPRRELQSITPGGPKERDYWSGKISMGLTLRSGNTKSMDYDAQVRLQRRTPGTRLTIDYLGGISAVEGTKNEDNHRVNAEFDFWVSRRLYLILPETEYFRDPFQNIAQRLTLGGGVGYDLINRRNLEWDISTGPAYQKTWADSVEAGEPTAREALAVTFGTKLDWEITRRVDLILEYRGQYTSRQVGETLHHSVSTLEFELTKRFDLDVSFVWDRVQEPKPESSGAVPEQNDFRLILGLGIRF